MVAIIGAMEEEVVLLQAKLENKDVKVIKNLEVYTGLLNGKEVAVVKCGIGKVNAALCTQMLIDNFDIESVINTGVAGGLNPTLGIGDIVISKKAVQHDFNTVMLGDPVGYISRMGMKDCYFPADEKLIKSAMLAAEELENIKYVVGTVASGDQFIAAKEAKDKIKKNFDADCAEMEGAAIAHACYVNNVPFVIIRAISDNADESADMSFEEFTHLAAKNSTIMIEKMISR